MNVVKYINPYYQNTVIRNKVLIEKKNCGFNSQGKNCEIKCVFLLLLIMPYRYMLQMHVMFYTNWNNRVMVVWVWCLDNTVQWLMEEDAAYIHILLGIIFIGIWMTMIGVLCWVKVTSFYVTVVSVYTVHILHDLYCIYGMYW
jgi:hypothetical protein